MAARKLKLHHQEDIRAKIRVSQIINRLQAGFHGEVELTATQVSIGKALLDKVLPDLKAIEHTGDENNPLAIAEIKRIIVDGTANTDS